MTDLATPDASDPGLFARAIGIVVSPTATFRAVVVNPRPAAILFLAAVVIALAVGVPQFTARGRQAAFDTMIQRAERSGQPLPPEAYDRMEKINNYLPYLTVASTFIVMPIVAIIFTAVYWAVFNTILGGTATFKQVLGIVTHSSVIGALGAVLGAPIQYFKNAPATMAGPFNLGALAPMLDPATFISSFLSAISVFTVWQLIVTAIGLAVLYKKRPTGIAVALLSVYLLITGAVTAALSSFTTGSR